MKTSKKILLTTSDYPPQIGGLSTFTLVIEGVLKKLNIGYDLIHWENLRILRKTTFNQKKYFMCINVHFLFSYYMRDYLDGVPQINFFHGSEILFYSPNFIKRLGKKILKRKILKVIEGAVQNIFISQFTLEKMRNKGLGIRPSRDIVIHNQLLLEERKERVEKAIGNEIVFCVLARDVPHKNIKGCIELVRAIRKVYHKEARLLLPNRLSEYTKKYNFIDSFDADKENEKFETLKRSHFNLLLSLDHSSSGFFEGFGLSILEAAAVGTPSIVFNTGGLPENVHDGLNGIVIDSCGSEALEKIVPFLEQRNFENLSANAYNHFYQSHNGNIYFKFFSNMIESFI